MINGSTKVSGVAREMMERPLLGYPSAWALEDLEDGSRTERRACAKRLFNKAHCRRVAASIALVAISALGAIGSISLGIGLADKVAAVGENKHNLSFIEAIDRPGAKREALTLLDVGEELASQSRLLLPLNVIEFNTISRATSIKGGDRLLEVTPQLAADNPFFRRAYEAFGQDKDRPMWGSPLSNSHGGRVEISLAGIRSFRILSRGIPAIRCVGMMTALDGIVGQAYLNGKISIGNGRLEPLAAVRQACSIKGGATIELRGGE